MTPAVCSCCGEVPELGSVQLQCHREIEICYRCLDWLNDKRDKQMAASDGGVRIVGVEPIFRVANMERSAITTSVSASPSRTTTVPTHSRAPLWAGRSISIKPMSPRIRCSLPSR